MCFSCFVFFILNCFKTMIKFCREEAIQVEAIHKLVGRINVFLISVYYLPVQISTVCTILNEHRSKTPGPLTLSENLLAWSMSQLRSLVLSVKDIRRRLWYSQRVKIKAESLSSSCSANSHFPWQQLKGGVWILLFFLWSHLSPHVQSFMS